MEFRRSAASDGRRRRALLDEKTSPETDESNMEEAESPVRERKGRGASSAKRYSDSALPENQPRISCVLPVRGLTTAALTFFGLLVITGIEFAYFKIPAAKEGQPAFFSLFDVTLPNSLAAWFSSMLLFSGAAISGIIFALRRHKLDDYRGRYRFWMWNAIALLIASIDCVTGLHDVLPHTIHTFAKEDPVKNANVYWIGFYAALFALGGIRLSMEMWSSWLARVFLLLTLSGFTAAAALKLGWSPVPRPEFATLLQSSTTLFSEWMLLMTLLTYGRYVHLDAQGIIQRTKAKKAKAKKEKEKEKAAKKEASQTPAPPVPEVSSKSSTGKVVRIDAAHLSSPSKEEDDEVETETRGPLGPHFDAGNRKLSKAERKKMRQ